MTGTRSIGVREHSLATLHDTDELVALSEEAARLGVIYHSHVRYRLGDRFLNPFREAIEIGRRSSWRSCCGSGNSAR